MNCAINFMFDDERLIDVNHRCSMDEVLGTNLVRHTSTARCRHRHIQRVDINDQTEDNAECRNRMKFMVTIFWFSIKARDRWHDNWPSRAWKKKQEIKWTRIERIWDHPTYPSVDWYISAGYSITGYMLNAECTAVTKSNWRYFSTHSMGGGGFSRTNIKSIIVLKTGCHFRNF